MEAGYLVNEEGQLLVESAVSRLRDNRSLLLFPEGTRSPQGGLGPFQRGAAHIALKSRRELLPVVITCDPPTLLKGQKWYEVPDRPAHLTLRVENPILPAEHRDAGTSPALAARRLTNEVWQFYKRTLSRAEL
jgi:1-acyl-sn-glycerol-3-phosphate acyltransferase